MELLFLFNAHYTLTQKVTPSCGMYGTPINTNHMHFSHEISTMTQISNKVKLHTLYKADLADIPGIPVPTSPDLNAPPVIHACTNPDDVLIHTIPNTVSHIRYLVCDVIHNDDAIGPSVVARCDGPKPFLTCCVPLNNTNNR